MCKNLRAGANIQCGAIMMQRCFGAPLRKTLHDDLHALFEDITSWEDEIKKKDELHSSKNKGMDKYMRMRLHYEYI